MVNNKILMKRNLTILPITYGDAKKFPVLVSIASMLNETDQIIYHRKVSTIFQEFHLIITELSKTKNEYSNYLYKLVLEDFSNRVIVTNLPIHIRTHVINYLYGYYKSKIEN